jgi:hypothetical protein
VLEISRRVRNLGLCDPRSDGQPSCDGLLRTHGFPCLCARGDRVLRSPSNEAKDGDFVEPPIRRTGTLGTAWVLSSDHSGVSGAQDAHGPARSRHLAWRAER